MPFEQSVLRVKRGGRKRLLSVVRVPGHPGWARAGALSCGADAALTDDGVSAGAGVTSVGPLGGEGGCSAGAAGSGG